MHHSAVLVISKIKMVCKYGLSLNFFFCCIVEMIAKQTTQISLLCFVRSLYVVKLLL